MNRRNNRNEGICIAEDEELKSEVQHNPILDDETPTTVQTKISPAIPEVQVMSLGDEEMKIN